MSDLNQCMSCGSDLTGPFCSQCGEQKLRPEHRKLSVLLVEFIENMTSLDGKFLKSFASLLLVPGSSEYNFHRGARIQYMKPIALFLLINIIFVVLMPLNDFYLSFVDQKNQVYSPLISDWLNQYIISSGLTTVEFEAQYNQLVKLLARSIIILSVPLLLPFVVLLFNHKKYFLSDHFVFSLNVYAWLMIWMLVSWWMSFGISILSDEIFDFKLNPLTLFSPMMVIGFIVYLGLAVKKMYLQSWFMIVFKIPVILAGIIVSHFLFRFFQLFITAWSISF